LADLATSRVKRPAALLTPYLHANPDTPEFPAGRAVQIFEDILANDNGGVFVSLIDDRLVATCVLATTANC
jgi:hypothetical protein